MANEILILRNVPRENPGLIEEIITEKKIKYRILDIDNNTIFPSTGQYNAVYLNRNNHIKYDDQISYQP